MLEFIQYATSGFWVFVGCATLVLILGSIFLSLVDAVLRFLRTGG
jgi:hypothetical protein